MAVAKSKLLSILLLGVFLGGRAGFAASGMFPKMPAAPKVFVFTISRDSGDARVTARALQGMINQQSAEVYLVTDPWDWEQLKASGKPFEVVEPLTGPDPGLRTLFKKYQSRVKKVIVYENVPDWSGYVALMAAAQQGGMAVTEPLWHHLAEEFDWKGPVENFQKKWKTRIDAYDWALANLMPNCSQQVLFVTRIGLPLVDYAVASRGFIFWLDFNAERSEVERVFRARRDRAGTTLMGYANTGDWGNVVANPFGIGYVVSDLYANGSFWSSFPNKTYRQAPGRAVVAQPGRIYASIMWSDGDNIQFDQNAIYHLWTETPHGIVPVATALSPTLQELNPPLLDWYYSKMTQNDELMAGPTGVQFIYIQDFSQELFPMWCGLTRRWCTDAGFHTVRIWQAPERSVNSTTYMKTCGMDGVIGESKLFQAGLPPRVGTVGAENEEDLFNDLARIVPDSRGPKFCNIACTAGQFCRWDRGYASILRQVNRIQAAYPGRYVFLLPKDQFATARNYYHLGSPVGEYADVSVISTRPGMNNGLSPRLAGDGEFQTVEHEGAPCWLPSTHTASRYFYLAKDEGFRIQPPTRLQIEVEYLDVGSGVIALDYDSSDVQATAVGAYKRHPNAVHRANTGQWRSGQFQLDDAVFAGRQNAGADFRIYIGGDDLLIRAVTVRRIRP